MLIGFIYLSKTDRQPFVYIENSVLGSVILSPMNRLKQLKSPVFKPKQYLRVYPNVSVLLVSTNLVLSCGICDVSID